MMMTENGLVSVEDHVCNLFAQAAVYFSGLFSLIGRIRTKSEPLNCLFYTVEIAIYYILCCVVLCCVRRNALGTVYLDSELVERFVES